MDLMQENLCVYSLAFDLDRRGVNKIISILYSKQIIAQTTFTASLRKEQKGVMTFLGGHGVFVALLTTALGKAWIY